MNIDAVILQLKAAAPVFRGNVAGVAEHAELDQVWLPRPAAYVLPLEDEPSELHNQTGYQQTVRERIGVIVDLDNSADRRGQEASSRAVDVMRAALLLALANWRTDELRQSRGFTYAGGGLIRETLNRARLQWQFDFTVETLISDEDVWQPPTEPLTDIRATVTDETGDAPDHTLATFDVALPQEPPCS